MKRNHVRVTLDLSKAASWSRRLISGAERRAAKGLWLASTRLGRLAYRLDAAGLTLAVEEGRSAPSHDVPAQQRLNGGEPLDDMVSPHLA